MAHLVLGPAMGLGLRGKAQRAVERTVGAIVPGSEFVFVAYHALNVHRKFYGVYPNLLHPRTFSEKILHRMVFDRRPILTRLQDKYAARDYVQEKIGAHVLPRLHWVTKTPADIPFDDLPDRFVVKANHGTGWVSLVPDKTRVNKQELIRTCIDWLRSSYYYGGVREWAYKNIDPCIMVEEYISDGTGLTPTEYRFCVFDGSVRLISVSTGRFMDLRSTDYTPSWERLEIRPDSATIEGPVPRPPHLDEMIACAEKLGDGLDFLRVDLFDAGKVYVGELTLYPGAGCLEWTPEWNRYLGGLWNLSFHN